MTWESDHVESARARGVSWFHVAQQVGKCEWDIRRRYDPELRADQIIYDAPPDAKPAASRVAKVVPPHRQVYRERAIPTVVTPGTRLAQVLELAVDGGVMTRKWIAEKIGVTPHAASDSISNLFQRDLLDRTRDGWLITDYGQEVAKLLREARG